MQKSYAHVPFDEVATKFQHRVTEWIATFRPLFKNLSDTDIERMAEQATYKEFATTCG